ncbi:hydroxyisourate hydrolase [Spiractinospora alimapuensis]|uniref:hydroxyisourate hydrolase n=1 Tax=Spiractinospora alimapuensis TaxID=2820884 RepID=UPI001EE9ED4F|nr:hydroxyisourate hydrolase [Spiractinospora alimapuensis]QVQ51814.1 hydroxyisourate hydrolase [Spiractinospora alimapuensis]
MSHVTTHVLDTALGRPAAGVPVTLEARAADDTWTLVAHGTTDDDGRISDLGPSALPAGAHRITFDTATYFDASDQRGFFPEITVTFELSDTASHYHVPLLLSPYSYSTYRGS